MNRLADKYHDNPPFAEYHTLPVSRNGISHAAFHPSPTHVQGGPSHFIRYRSLSDLLLTACPCPRPQSDKGARSSLNSKAQSDCDLSNKSLQSSCYP